MAIFLKKIKEKLKEKKFKKFKKGFWTNCKLQRKLDELNSEFKSANNIKNLKQFVKEVCTIVNKGEVFKVMMKL